MRPIFGSDSYTLSRLAAAGMHLELSGHAEVPRSGQARSRTVSLMLLGAAAFAPVPTVPDKSGELGADFMTWCAAAEHAAQVRTGGGIEACFQVPANRIGSYESLLGRIRFDGGCCFRDLTNGDFQLTHDPKFDIFAFLLAR
jgi:hypothetical protein